MDRVLKAVVRDHRLPCDYNYKYTQPFHTKIFLTNFKKFLLNRQMTKQNVTLPMFVLFVSPNLIYYLGLSATLHCSSCFVQSQNDRICSSVFAGLNLAL